MSFTRWAFFGFFLSHIPITLMFDLQPLFREHYPEQVGVLFVFPETPPHPIRSILISQLSWKSKHWLTF
jgi:hypothetical protein